MTAGAIRERVRRNTTTRERRDSVVNVRMTRQTRELIDEAAEAVGKTRSEFMVESARTHAIDVLLDKRLFSLGTEHYHAFLKALDAPPAPNEKLKRLLRNKSPWEQ